LLVILCVLKLSEGTPVVALAKSNTFQTKKLIQAVMYLCMKCAIVRHCA